MLRLRPFGGRYTGILDVQGSGRYAYYAYLGGSSSYWAIPVNAGAPRRHRLRDHLQRRRLPRLRVAYVTDSDRTYALLEAGFTSNAGNLSASV